MNELETILDNRPVVSWLRRIYCLISPITLFTFLYHNFGNLTYFFSVLRWFQPSHWPWVKDDARCPPYQHLFNYNCRPTTRSRGPSRPPVPRAVVVGVVININSEGPLVQVASKQRRGPQPNHCTIIDNMTASSVHGITECPFVGCNESWNKMHLCIFRGAVR